MTMDLTQADRSSSSLFFREYLRESEGALFFSRRFRYKLGVYEYDCPASILAELVFAEHQFRYQAQLMDGLTKRTIKEPSSNGFTAGTQTDCHHNHLKEVQEIRRIYVEREMTLYLKEAALPAMTLAPLYNYIRTNPRWYLGKWMVSECAARGGCCSRGCDCCSKRLLRMHLRSMSGHCSLACPCCERTKGSVIDSDRVALLDQRYKEALESDNPAFLARIASNYFAPGQSSGGHRAS